MSALFIWHMLVLHLLLQITGICLPKLGGGEAKTGCPFFRMLSFGAGELRNFEICRDEGVSQFSLKR